MALLEIVLFGAVPFISGIAMLTRNWVDIDKYLESGKVKAIANVGKENSDVGDLTAVDGVLVASSTSGLLLLMGPKTRWVGLGALLGSFLISTTRDNAKLIGVTSSALAFTATNPIAATSAAFGFLGSAASATVNSLGSAVQLSLTVTGVLVTASGAIVGYLVSSKKTNKKKSS